MAFLVYREQYMNPGDSDIPVWIIMGVSAYLLAPWSSTTAGGKCPWPFLRLASSRWPLRRVAHVRGNPTWRVGNAYASVPMYLACMIISGRNRAWLRSSLGFARDWPKFVA